LVSLSQRRGPRSRVGGRFGFLGRCATPGGRCPRSRGTPPGRPARMRGSHYRPALGTHAAWRSVRASPAHLLLRGAQRLPDLLWRGRELAVEDALELLENDRAQDKAEIASPGLISRAAQRPLMAKAATRTFVSDTALTRSPGRRHSPSPRRNASPGGSAVAARRRTAPPRDTG